MWHLHQGSQVRILLLGLYQISRGRKEAQASRDLQVVLSLSSDFRTRCEAGWDKSVRRWQTQRGAEVPAGAVEQLRYMLNWVDWLGNLIHGGHLTNTDGILGAIGIPIAQMLEIGRPVVESDLRQHGPSYWRGFLTVADLLQVEFGREQLV